MNNVKELPQTWGSKEVEDLVLGEITQWKSKKIAVAENVGFRDNFGFIDHLNSITIPELFAAYCAVISGRREIMDTSASLQAFQTYRVSLFDILDDNHLEVFGQPTVLKLYGEEYVHRLDKLYKKAISFLANELREKGIKDAPSLVEKQYDEVLLTDKVRNANYNIFPSPLEAIESHEKNAGGTARFAASLSGGNSDLEILVSSLANAMACCDDLVDMVSGRDLEHPKLTVPLSYLAQEIGNVKYMGLPYLKDLVLRGAAFEQTKAYILSQLEKPASIMGKYPLLKKTLIPRFLREMHTFLEVFSENYV